MSGRTFARWTAVAWCVAFNPVLPLSAQDQNVGVIRISDGPKGSVQPAGHRNHGAYMTTGAGDCPCPQCHGSGCPHCCHHGCLSGHCLNCLFPEHYCKNSADFGYSIPGKYPIERRGVQYTNYFPATWYGSGAASTAVAYPMVYQPTDTTQLGFYYQHVPFWMPQPNPLPQRPVPARWHHYAPAVPASAFHHSAGYGVGYCPVVEGTPVNNGTVPPAPQTLQPVPNDPAPPRPSIEESAADAPFRRASNIVEPVPAVE